MLMLVFSAVSIRHLFAAAVSVLLAFVSTHAQDGFPVPAGNINQLFYLQRTSNTNTIVCELNYKDGLLNEKKPVHVFWIRYAEQGQHEELSYIQRTFAYGIKTKFLSKDKYELRFVSYKKYPMHLMKATNGKYYVFVKIQGKQAILNRLFIKINGGSFWSPNVEYMEIKGIDITNGNEMLERIKP
jgi:hypothetical protein